MNVEYHPEAKKEFFKTINYYEECETGLGYDFSIEVLSAIQNIIDYPHAWPVLEEDVRRHMTNRFPYGILYSIEPDRIFILAVMHLHQDPESWKGREKQG